jgi:hypothetical protein
MKKYSLCVWLIILNFFFLATHVRGQDKRGVTLLKFNVVDKETKVPVKDASVYVKSKTNTLFKGLSDISGSFVIDLRNPAADTINIIISAVGYDRYEVQKAISDQDRPISIELLRKTLLLQEVEVMNKKKLVEDIQGGYKFNTDKMNAVHIGDALELLGQVPGIVVDPAGVVLLRGASTKIFINGKPTNISGPMLQSLLRSQNSKNIESIVVYTDPPSKFDAAGSGGIIDIVLKKNKEKGFTGFTSTGAANLPAFDFNTNLTYRSDKLTIYGGGSVYYREGESVNENLINYKRITNDANTFLQNEVSKQRMNGYYVNFGADYQFDTVNTIGSNIKYIDFNGRFPKVFSSQKVLHSSNALYYTQNNNNKMNNSYLLMDMNYKRKFLKSNGVLDIDVNYANAINRTFIDFNQDYYNNDAPQGVSLVRDQNNLTDIKYNFYVLSGDYEKKISKNSDIEIGLKSTRASNLNDYVVITSINGSAPVQDLNLSNALDYKESINSGYFVFSSKLKSFSYSIGLRMEHTDYAINPNQINNSYFSFFPNLYGKLKLKNNQQLSLNLSRRIERPSYEILNPFIDNSNPNELNKGNPYLKPSYSNKFQLNYSKYWSDTHSLLVSGYVTYIQDIFGQIKESTIDKDVILNTYKNYQKGLNYGFYLTEESSFDKISINLYFGLRKNNYSIRNDVNDVNIENPLVTYESNAQFNYRIHKNYSIQISGDYKSRSNYLQVRTKASGTVNVAFTGKFSKSLSYAVSLIDLFKTSRTFTDIDNENLSGIYRSTWKSRYGIIRLNYGFGGSIKERTRVKVQENDRYKSN